MQRERAMAQSSSMAMPGLAVAALAALALPSSAGMPSDTSVTLAPANGGAHTTFVASFTAPFAASERDQTYYFLEAVGPPGCAKAYGAEDKATAGEALELRLGSGDVTLPKAGGVARWCSGSYIANLYYQGQAQSVLLGNWTFRVSGGARAGVPAQKRTGASLTPGRGSARTTFVARFRAPFKADGSDSMYYVEAFGPPGCALATSYSDRVTRGSRVALRLASRDVSLPGRARRWCNGAYAANLVYQPKGWGDEVLLGSWRFRVS